MGLMQDMSVIWPFDFSRLPPAGATKRSGAIGVIAEPVHSWPAADGRHEAVARPDLYQSVAGTALIWQRKIDLAWYAGIIVGADRSNIYVERLPRMQQDIILREAYEGGLLK